MVADARALPFGDGVFQAVYSIAGLVHLDERGVRSAVSEMVRVSGEGGVFYVSLRAGEDSSRWEDSPWRVRWYREWQPETIRHLCEDAGVKVSEVTIEADATRREIAWVSVYGAV